MSRARPACGALARLGFGLSAPMATGLRQLKSFIPAAPYLAALEKQSLMVNLHLWRDTAHSPVCNPLHCKTKPFRKFGRPPKFFNQLCIIHADITQLVGVIVNCF
jgi:hypothetical protein